MRKVNFRKKGATTVNVSIAGAILGFLVLIGFGIGAAIFGIVPMGENAPGTQAGSISCSNWNEPFDYQEVFTKAAGSYKISPAILATIFSSEHHTTSWPDSPRTVQWKSSPVGASGPFQFMPATWRSNGVDANGDGKKDIQNLDDAAFGAARYIQAQFSIGAGKRYTSTDKVDIQVVAGCYNAGCGRLDQIKQYATTGDDSGLRAELGNDYLQTKNYMDKAWEYFQTFNNGCSANNGASGPSIGSYDTTFMNQEPIKSWLSTRKKQANKQLKPTGITLHWTGAWPAEGADGVKRLIDLWHERTNECGTPPCDPYNHLVIDKQGKVYQLVPFNIKQAGSGTNKNAGGQTANDFTIGIEIAGTGYADLNDPKNQAQKDKVIGVVRSLIDNYSIPNVRGNGINFDARVGIFGHYQVGTHPDPTKEYMDQIWTAVGAK